MCVPLQKGRRLSDKLCWFTIGPAPTLFVFDELIGLYQVTVSRRCARQELFLAGSSYFFTNQVTAMVVVVRVGRLHDLMR